MLLFELLSHLGSLLKPLINCRLSRSRLLELIQCPMLIFAVNFDGNKIGVFSSLYRVFVVNFYIIKVNFFTFIGRIFDVIIVLACFFIIGTVVLNNFLYRFTLIIAFSFFCGRFNYAI